MVQHSKQSKLSPFRIHSVSKNGSSAPEPIAIVGIGCRFPGGADSPEAFWRLMREGVDAITFIPADRPELSALYDSTPGAPGKIVTEQGGFLSNLDLFDPLFFGISPREAKYIDPQQRLLLEVTWEAFEDAGIVPAKLGAGGVGVFIGMWTSDYEDRMYDATSDIDLYITTGGGRYSASGRLSYVFDLRGPSMTIDTACSSSLVAAHLACQSLRCGECDMAIAGGVNLILKPYISIGYSKSKMLSPDGRCRFGDAGANGYVRSEGVGVVLLKCLSQALAEGDPIYALIRGSAVNNDGQSSGVLVAPGSATQEIMLRQAYRSASVDPSAVHYVEAHGTGTSIGDPVEVAALGAVLGENRPREIPCLMGSVKTNIGHTEAASGIAGLIKVALCLKHREIPPSLHLKVPNPKIPWQKLSIKMQQEHGPWPAREGSAFAAVNSFGITGTNAHVVLQEAPFSPAASAQTEKDGEKAHLLPLSAHNGEALRDLTEAYRIFLSNKDQQDPCSLDDVCYTASIKRTHHHCRLAVAGHSYEEFVARLEADLEQNDSKFTLSCAGQESAQRIAFVFSGQGPQWFAMGRELLRQEPMFREAIEQCDALLGKLAGWSLKEEFQRDEADSRFGETQFAQPAIFALQVGLAALWRSWGIIPDAVIGHSVGEVAAAHVAGALTLKDAVTVIYHRGHLMQLGTGNGKMASVELSEAEVRNLLRKYTDRLAVAAINSPTTTVLSGDSHALNEVIQPLQARNVVTRMLPVNYAFHSPQMDPCRIELVRVLKGLKARATSIPMISTVTGEVVQGGSLNATYWGRNVREPVRFADGIAALLADGLTTFVEISPHPVLSVAIAQCASHRDCHVSVLCSLRRGQEERLTMLAALGELYSARHNIDWGKLYPSGSVVKLPAYPWQRERYWIDERKNTVPANSRASDISSSLRSEVQSLRTDWLYQITWESKPRRDQTSPHEKLSYLPSPSNIVAGLRSKMNELGAQNDLRQFVAVWPDLEDLSLAYVLQLLQRLGWDGWPVAREALPEHLGIVERHRRFFDRLLGMLEEVGILENRDGKWKLLASTQLDNPKLRTKKLLREYPECSTELELVSRCGERLAEVLRGRCDPLQLLFPENDSVSVESLYCDAPFMKTANALIRRALELALKNLPEGQTVRIIEIGAGTGGTTRHILSCLPPERTQYVFTDVSNSFLISAAQKFSSYSFIRYRLLDLEKDPQLQGFEASEFDIVIAANVLHATADLSRTLRHVKDLLAPRGLLVLVEGTGPQQWLDLIFGMLEGWWKFIDRDLRPKHALISQSQWIRLLNIGGFEHAATFPAENEQGLIEQCIIMAQASRIEQTPVAAHEWLIFADSSGLADRLKQLLSNRGDRCVLVSAGVDFRQVNFQHFEINPANPYDFERVWMHVCGREPNSTYRVVYLWSLDMTPLDNATAEELEPDQVSTCGSVIHLVRALAKHAVNARVWLVSRGAQPVTQHDALSVTQSPIWGLGRVIALEHPEFWGGLIDLEEGAEIPAQVSQLWQEIGDDDPDAEDQLAFRDNQRYAPRLMRWVSDIGERESQSDRPAPEAALFVPEGSYLITGGLGRLGLTMALWMAQRGARYLVLVSRRQLPKRSTWAELSAKDDAYEASRQIQSIESLGATVRLVSADVSDLATMSDLFAEFGRSMPSVRGVVHGAAVLDVHLITEMDVDALKDSLRPKVMGAWVLHQLTKQLSLDFFVTFSSIASVWGIRGRGHYAAGNEFLDALAHYRSAMGLPALSINWGWWAGGGTNLEAERSAMQVGLEAMSGAEALDLLSHLLTKMKETQVTVAACNWSVMKPIYEAKKRRPILDKIAPRLVAMESSQTEKQQNLLQCLRETPSSERADVLRVYVAEQVARVLGVSHAQSLDPNQGFFRMGMDSLMSVQLRQRLEKNLGGCSLPLTVAFEYPNITALARYLGREVLDLDAIACQTKNLDEDNHDISNREDKHGRLSEDEIVDLLAKKLEQLR